MYNLSQKLLAEFIGTFILVFVAAGSLCAGQYVRPGTQPPAAGLLSYALAYGLATAVLTAVLSHISGANLNPAITIGLWVTRRTTTPSALLYCLAQLAGSVAAAFALSLIVPDPIWTPAGLGATDLAPDFTRMQGMLLEGVLTFFLVFVFFASVVDLRSHAAKFGGFAAGLIVTVDVLVGAPFTGACLNPARIFGPALVARHWVNHGVYWLGPLIGGVLASVLYDRIFLRDQPPA